MISRISGEGMSYILMRARVCERMGWTFPEYDAAPADSVFELVELWRMERHLK